MVITDSESGTIEGTYLDGAVLLLRQEDIEHLLEVLVEVVLASEALVEPLQLVGSQTAIHHSCWCLVHWCCISPYLNYYNQFKRRIF